MMQKGIPSRHVLSAEEIFEPVKPERIWVMIRSIFEVFAMHDVQVLKPKILAWVSSIVTYYNPFRANKEPLPSQMSTRQFYQFYQTGLPLFYILHLYIRDGNLKPDPAQIFEFPQSKQELHNNLTVLVQIQYKINGPVYLTP